MAIEKNLCQATRLHLNESCLAPSFRRADFSNGNGGRKVDAAWNYLNTRPLKNPSDCYVLSQEETARLKAFQIEPSTEGSLKAPRPS